MFQSVKDRDYVAECRNLLPTSWHQWHPCAVFHRQSCAVGAWPWCHTRQPAVSLCSHCCAVSVWLLSVATDATSYPVTHTWRCQDYCSGVYCQSFGLVQHSSEWCAREPAEEGAVSRERCCSSTHQHMQMWPHHSTATSFTLAASPETSGVQDLVPTYLTTDIHLLQGVICGTLCR